MKIQAIFAFVLFGVASVGVSEAGASPLVILDQESAASAATLQQLLSGPNVMVQNGTKTVLLDGTRNVVLSCSSNPGQCSISNSGFEPILDRSDYDQLLTLTGTAAERLAQSLPSLKNESGEFRKSLGHSGPYGEDFVYCSVKKDASQCQIYRTYCYQPGC